MGLAQRLAIGLVVATSLLLPTAAPAQDSAARCANPRVEKVLESLPQLMADAGLPSVAVGEAVIRGTRVTLRTVLASLAEGATVEEMLRDFPFGASPSPEAEHWTAVELTFESARASENPYVETEFWVEFTNEAGTTLKRPGFWDGGTAWKVRFAPPAAGERWTWASFTDDASDTGLHGRSGTLSVTPYTGDNPLLRHGLLRMSPGGRNVVHADGTPFLVVADTPWALPFRGTVESVTTYARNRQERGFNAALLMAVQPDQNATGPRDRTQPESFGVAFEDLSAGRLNEINVEYFQHLDRLVGILLDHGIVPVFNPVFQGFGWKGLNTLGSGADVGQYLRFQKYLLARYGAAPALWLPSADATGRAPVVEPAGRLIEAWDCYGQPTGIHYSPFDDKAANWSADPIHGFHYNRMHQDAPWLDFQWAQSGHNGVHMPHKVELMYDNRPIKGVANGEPTYEAIGRPDNATGWWQGHEAWLNLVSGGTMGVVYGAGGLWNWKLTPDEPGWPDWANTAAAWSDAIEFEGSRYVGYLSRALAGMDFADMAKRPDLAGGQHLLTVPGRFYLAYLPEGGEIRIERVPAGLPWRWFDPRRGTFASEGETKPFSPALMAPDNQPWVLVIGHPRRD